MRYYWEYRGSNNFNPRTSYEVRLGQHKKFQPQVDFNPRTSYEVRRDHGRTVLSLRDFNPRTSYEVRLRRSMAFISSTIFQSTHLLRGATLSDMGIEVEDIISIHAPLTRCDPLCCGPVGHVVISIHAPLTRCDWNPWQAVPVTTTFQSTHLLRGATVDRYRLPQTLGFQSTHLLRGATVDRY